MWQLHYKGKLIGPKYGRERDAIEAYIKIYPCLTGVGWRKVVTDDSRAETPRNGR